MRPVFRTIQDKPDASPCGDATIVRPKSIYILNTRAFDLIYGPEERNDIEKYVDIIAPAQTCESILEIPGALAEVELILTGWGGPLLDEAFLDSVPRLKAVFHGAGSVAPIVTQAVWDGNITVTTAYAANAVPVAEYTLGVILFSLKHGWRLSRTIRENASFRAENEIVPGCYQRTVGLVSMGMVARTLLKHLQLCDIRVVAYDPFVSGAEADMLGVELVSLESLFKQSDVVSLHTPYFAETAGLITGKHIAAMKPGATFINTARGAIVREDEMLDVLEVRPDLQAVLDVCVQEPPQAESRLFSLPNIVLTPHLAGSVGTECRRMGRFMVEELERYVSGQPLQGLVTSKLAERSSHRPMRPRKASEPVAVE
jgi:phosphoglycerate dehydrogenase-like enzyme